MRKLLWLPVLYALSACGGPAPGEGNDSESNQVATSGKTEVPLGEVPPQVLAAAAAAKPGFKAAEAESETREGRRYFDVGGTLPDGSEVEFDIMEEDGRWRVVETQRDIRLEATPAAVRDMAGKFPAERVIESRQADGLIIYELYDSQQRKLEIKWDGNTAVALTREWAH